MLLKEAVEHVVKTRLPLSAKSYGGGNGADLQSFGDLGHTERNLV